ncbi:MAG: DUF3467 domain-containing protein [Longimonas sp.]|uniref:DUF3467 domain-containing protein n=1 Tax=Longimonas sp. TaxID=2039626 RepID=UPI003349997F
MATFNPNADGDSEMNIELTKEEAEGTYANLVMIAHSPEEFILDFIRVVPGVKKARVKSRIIVTPQHAKRLLGALKENIQRYEEAHGAIAEPNQDDGEGGAPPMNFGGFRGKA